MTLGSLFAGIGGIDLGFERAGFKTVWQVEINPYCRKVLERHFPNAQRFEDVRTVGRHNLKPVDVIAGGFPCQDISNAGKRDGIDGERSGLWSEYARIIGELRPKFVLVENVSALLGRGMGRVLGDLSALGYDAEWSSFPTGHRMGHRRERLFLVANPMQPRFSFGRHPYKDGVNSPVIFARERFAGVLEKRDLRSQWADRPLLGRGISRIPNRVDRIRSLGNAVVPQISELIANRIRECLEAAEALEKKDQ